MLLLVYCLCNYNNSVIELGAGTGALGIVCATLGADVIITDGPMGYTSLIEENVALNTPSLQLQRHHTATAKPTTHNEQLSSDTAPSPGTTENKTIVTNSSDDEKWKVNVAEFFW
jgi:tRNA1(Val) A37 N6-methylase TrmN6